MAPLTDEWIEEQLRLCKEATKEGVNIGFAVIAMNEGYPLVLKELLRLRKQRCETCHFFHYDDLGNEWLCSLRITDNMPDWYCADWKQRKDATDANTE